MSRVTAWVVTCEQEFADHWRLVGAFDDIEEARRCLAKTPDGVLYECDGEDCEQIAPKNYNAVQRGGV